MSALYQTAILLCLCSLALSDRPTVCPSGYDQVDFKCFKILNLSLTFFEAITACDVIDGKLVEVASPADQTRVVKYLVGLTTSQLTSNTLWLGATNLRGKWMYLTSKNEAVLDTWTCWAPGYPIGPTREERNNCASLDKNSNWRWQDVPCSYHMGALCYVELREPDTSNDIVG